MTDFLYPFIDGDERDAGALLRDLAASAGGKLTDSDEIRARAIEANAAVLASAATAMADRFRTGGRLLTFGNGGSSTDATTLAALFAEPRSGTPLPARCLTEDSAVLTALGNDVGYELVFSRQIIAHGRAGDIVIGFSTSGGSRNLLTAFDEAARRDILTIGLAGYDGGEMAQAGLDHCLIVRSDSVHRIQEAEAALAHALWRTVQDELAGERVHG